MKRLVFVCAVLLGLWLPWGLPATAKDKEEAKVGDTGFIAYEGPQDWPTAKSTQIIKDYSIPIYIGLPDKGYKVLGRVYDKRTSGFDEVGRGFDEAFGKEKYRMRDTANQAKLHDADAVMVTDDEKVLKVFNLKKKDLDESAPLFDYKGKIVLAIKLQ
jgi:hypothetical protein